MKILSKITPAETMLIMDCTSVELRDLIKFTFMDLLRKKVIEVKEISEESQEKNTTLQSNKYVVAGKNFSTYKPKNHETHYLSPFTKSASIQILFKHFVKMVYQFSNGSWSYSKLIRTNQGISNYFVQGFFLKLFRTHKLTDTGARLKNDLSKYLKDVDKKIEHLLDNDKEKGLELLVSLGGNIFLLKNIDFKLLQNIDKEFAEQLKIGETDTDDLDSDWYLDFDYFEDAYLLDSYFETSEDTYGSFDSDFEDSESSSDDSGCSSCSDGD